MFHLKNIRLIETVFINPILRNIPFWSTWKHHQTKSVLMFLGDSWANRGKKSLQKIPQFHLISWCGNFVERHSFHFKKLGEITIYSEATIWRCSVKKVFLEISQKSQESTSARVFFNKVAALGLLLY